MVQSNVANEYSPITGFVFIFNLIVGAGALTIPHSFVQTGLLYGSVLLALLAVTSYITATFVVECIAGVHALKTLEKAKSEENVKSSFRVSDHTKEKRSESPGLNHDEAVPLLEEGSTAAHLDGKNCIFDISDKTELAQLAQRLFNRQGLHAFSACVVIYLYGDLAIYAVAVPKSLREMICPRPSRESVWVCYGSLDSYQVYQIFVIAFAVIFGAFAMGDVQKTKLMQLITTIIRHTSFGLMIVLAIIGIIQHQGRSLKQVLAYEDPTEISTFLGVCIYSFMCHHSIPGLVAPIANKKKVRKVLLGAFLAVFIVYIILCGTAAFRFTPEEIHDVYTLNFLDHHTPRIEAYFLNLFPVFTLSANFPLIAITLRENLMSLFQERTLGTSTAVEGDCGVDAPSRASGKRYYYGLAALIPPVLIAFFTEDVALLVGITGAYAGLGIQWIVPTCLVFALRQQLDQVKLSQAGAFLMENSDVNPQAPLSTHNPFSSPFHHKAWVYSVLALSIVFLVLITVIRLI
ncbi:unnamed protein product [Albugo candida]|uniref:Amino acid transporter transmembrane domain-containing protein n=1 Tax=Albugo candida TaxID=65357 RepID=A0A024GCB1_9STRA|nr:unnamed protein product [Albugo candida]|eukprot:CCI44489.1 unnamed protein product [Albugo candida]